MGRERCAQVVEESAETEKIRGRVVFSTDELSRKLAQHVKRFVCQARTADHADRIAPVLIRNRIESLGHVANRFIPGCGNQLAAFLVTNQRRANARFVVDERMSEASLDAEKLAVDAVDVTITRDRTQHLAAARAERHLATIRTEIARGDTLRELPWTRLVTISRVEQSSGRTDLDAVAALRTVEPPEIRADHGVRAASASLDRLFAHPLVTHARAAFAH